MQNLLKKKLEAVERLKSCTEEIMKLSPRLDHKKIKSMLERRKKLIEEISSIDRRLKPIYETEEDAEEATSIRTKIKETVLEIIEMDKTIRKNISSEIKNISPVIKKPEKSSKLLNIKA